MTSDFLQIEIVEPDGFKWYFPVRQEIWTGKIFIEARMVDKETYGVSVRDQIAKLEKLFNVRGDK